MLLAIGQMIPINKPIVDNSVVISSVVDWGVVKSFCVALVFKIIFS